MVVKRFPTVCFFCDGRRVWRWVGGSSVPFWYGPIVGTLSGLGSCLLDVTVGCVPCPATVGGSLGSVVKCVVVGPDILVLVCEKPGGLVASIKRAGQQSEQRRRTMEAYLEWLLTPASERVLKTKVAFADALGVTSQSLRNYARDPWLQSEMSKRGRAINKVERAGDVVDSLFAIATDPEQSPSARVSAGRVFLEWTDKVVADLSPSDLQEMTFDQLRELLDDMERAALA